MTNFAATNQLEFHGGIDELPDKPVFNAYVARGYSYWFGDDLDLWIVSNPFEPGEMVLNGISKKPWQPDDTKLAHDLLAQIKPLQCKTLPKGHTPATAPASSGE